MTIGLLLALVQASPWASSPATVTMGDTVVLARPIPGPPGVVPHLTALVPTPMVEPLEAPVVRLDGEVLTVRYAVALFTPGRTAIPMPDIELFSPDGQVVLVSGDTAWVEVAALIPRGDTLPHPAPALEPVPRAPPNPLPLVFAVAGVLGGLAVWGARRRRPGRRPATAAVTAGRPEPPVDRWVALGELRAAAAVAADGLRAAIAQAVPPAGRHLAAPECLAVLREERPDWPLRQLGAALRELERGRFAQAVPSDIVTVIEEANALARRLAAGWGERTA